MAGSRCFAGWRMEAKNPVHIARRPSAAPSVNLVGRSSSFRARAAWPATAAARARDRGAFGSGAKMLRQSLKSLGVDPLRLLGAAGIEETAARRIFGRGLRPLARGLTADFRHDPMIRQSMTATAIPLCEMIVEAPSRAAPRCWWRISRCGVCHSTCTMQDGYSRCGDKKLDVTGGRSLPFTFGHEIGASVEQPARRRTSRSENPSRFSLDRLRAMRGLPGRGRDLWRRRAILASRSTAALPPCAGAARAILIDHGGLSAGLAGALYVLGTDGGFRHSGALPDMPGAAGAAGRARGVGMMGLAFARALFRSRRSSRHRCASARPRSRPAPRPPTIQPIRRRARRC